MSAVKTKAEEGKSATQMANDHRQRLLEQEITVRCMDCPDFEAVGPAREARLEWAEHRRDEHDDDSAMRSVERMDRELTLKDLRTPANSSKLTPEFVIAAVKRYVRDNGRAPRSADWNQPRDKRGDYPSYSAVLRVFPLGWRAMLEAAASAGVDLAPATQISPPDPHADLDEAVAPTAAASTPPSEAPPNGNAGVSGGEPSSDHEEDESMAGTPGPQFDADAIVEAIQAFVREKGRTPSTYDFGENGLPGLSTVKRRSWSSYPASLTSHDVALTLGLFTVVEVEPEWCSECHKLERGATYYRSVTSGVVVAVGRRMGKLAGMGLVARNEKHPSLYTITAEGEALLDDARDAAIAHLREAVG